MLPFLIHTLFVLSCLFPFHLSIYILSSILSLYQYFRFSICCLFYQYFFFAYDLFLIPFSRVHFLSIFLFTFFHLLSLSSSVFFVVHSWFFLVTFFRLLSSPKATLLHASSRGRLLFSYAVTYSTMLTHSLLHPLRVSPSYSSPETSNVSELSWNSSPLLRSSSSPLTHLCLPFSLPFPSFGLFCSSSDSKTSCDIYSLTLEAHGWIKWTSGWTARPKQERRHCKREPLVWATDELGDDEQT